MNALREMFRRPIAIEPGVLHEDQRRDQASRHHDGGLPVAEDVADSQQGGRDLQADLRLRQDGHAGIQLRRQQRQSTQRELHRGAHGQTVEDPAPAGGAS